MRLFIILIQVMFIGLKLTDNIDWSWLWVMSPFISLVLFIIFGLILIFIEKIS